MGKKFLNNIILTITLCISGPLLCLASDISQLSFSTDGRTRMIVTNPDGEKTGSHGASYFTASANVELNLHSQSQNVSYTNAKFGMYILDFRGQYNEQYGFDISYIHKDKYNEYNLTRWASSKENKKMLVAVSQSEDGDLEFESKELNMPYGQAIKDSGVTNLTWTAVQDAVSYTVLYKYNDYPYYKIYSLITATSTATDIPWATYTNDGTPINLYYFRIQANLENGNTTVLSPIISNDDMDNDRYSDYREIDMGTDPNNADTDGDGLGDFSEMNQYYTDPNNPDSDNDGQDDGDEVAVGTLPNNADSYTGRIPDCDAPQSGPWHVSGNCDVQTDQSVTNDIIVHNNALMRIQKDVTVWFDYYKHKILVMFGAGIQLDPGASIKQK